jgi:hypothetical protein
MTTPDMDFALSQPLVPDFVAVEVVLPFYTLRLLDGASRVTFPVQNIVTGVVEDATFVGEDATYGTLGGLESVSEGLGTSSPKLRFVIRTPTLTAAAQLNLPTNQGSPIRMWYGVVHPEYGNVIPSPEELFWGELDQPRFVGGRRARAVEYDVSSAMELLFAAEEGQRLTHAFLQSYAPGAMGLEYVVDVERQLPWGSDVARPPLVSAANGGYGGPGGYVLPTGTSGGQTPTGGGQTPPSPGGGGGGGGGVTLTLNVV